MEWNSRCERLLLDDQRTLFFNDFPLILFLDKNVQEPGLSDDGTGFAFAHQLSGNNGRSAEYGGLHIFDVKNNIRVIRLQEFQPFGLVDHRATGSDTMIGIVKQVVKKAVLVLGNGFRQLPLQGNQYSLITTTGLGFGKKSKADQKD